MASGTLLPTRPRAAAPLAPVQADEPLEEEEEGLKSGTGGSADHDRFFGSEVEVQPSRRDGVPKMRHSETGLSTASHLSAISQMSALHKMHHMHPKMRRSQTALSSLSQKTGSSAKSQVPEELGGVITGLRGHSTVSYNIDWPVTDDYDFEDHLGEGAFGQVFMAKQRATGEYFAVKRIPAVSVKDVQRYEREIKVFERLCSPFVVRLYEIFRDESFLFLVMDLCTGGDLMAYLMNYWTDPAHPERQHVIALCPHDHHTLPASEVGCLVWQMLAGIAYLHHHRFVHRDVKLENYMLTKKQVNPQLQVCDFGLSIRLERDEKVTGTVGTLLYMAPEVLAGRYDHKCDIWSVGVSSYIVATMCSPWGSSSDEQDMRQRILSNRREPWPKVDRPSEMKKVIDRMMTPSDQMRPSAKDVYAQSRWLRKHKHTSDGKIKGSSSCPLG